MLRTDQPLWLPQGSVRAILALSVVGAFFAGLVDMEVALLVLGSYFVGRANAPAQSEVDPQDADF
jgi:hypothetical protein